MLSSRCFASRRSTAVATASSSVSDPSFFISSSSAARTLRSAASRAASRAFCALFICSVTCSTSLIFRLPNNLVAEHTRSTLASRGATGVSSPVDDATAQHHLDTRPRARRMLGSAESSAAPGPASCGTGSWIAGTVDLCDGVLVYRDYVLDDYGAIGGGNHRWNGGVFSEPLGGARYPESQDPISLIKYADLVALRMWIVGDRLHVSFELNALFTTGQTFAALAIDTDANAATGGGAWGSLLASAPANAPPGLPLTSTGWEVLHVFEQGDPDTTAIDTTECPAAAPLRVCSANGCRRSGAISRTRCSCPPVPLRTASSCTCTASRRRTRRRSSSPACSSASART
jgi:hypothetical protein